jgi:Mg-chelatase subunit ChlD
MAAVSEKKVKRAAALISEIVSAELESRGDAAQPEGVNLSLILDSSGSMTENDPDELRIDAAKMIVDQLPPAAAVSIVDFDGSAETLVSTSGVSPSRQNTLTASGRPQVKEAIERIDADGNTHIGRALKEGARTLRDNARLQNVALLLTDGKGEYDGEVRSYRENGWCLYTIALGSEPNLQLLRSLADSTCGKYMKATSAIDVSREFGQVLNDIQETPLLATRQGELKPNESVRHTVSVDETVEDLRLQLTWPGSSMGLQLTGPNGRPVETTGSHGETYVVARAEDVASGEYSVEVNAQQVGSAGEPYWLQVSGASSLRPEIAQFPTSVRPGRTAPIQVELPAAVVRPQSVQAEATQYANAGGTRKSLSLTRRQRGDTLSFVGQLPPANTEGDRRVVVRITGNTQGGSSFRRVVDRTYTVTPDAEITRPTIKRVIGTQVVLRGARAFGLQPGLTIYVQAPDGRRVGEGIITSTDGSRATVDLQAIMGAKEITPQYAISYDPIQWRADR